MSRKHSRPSPPPMTTITFCTRLAVWYPRGEGRFCAPRSPPCFHFILSSELLTSSVQTSSSTCNPFPPPNTQNLFWYIDLRVCPSWRWDVRRGECRARPAPSPHYWAGMPTLSRQGVQLEGEGGCREGEGEAKMSRTGRGSRKCDVRVRRMYFYITIESGE